MLAQIFTRSPKTKTYKCRSLAEASAKRFGVDARHNGIFGFDQETFSRSKVILIGAGGINGEIGEGLVRKGIGALHIFDGDTVEMTNLNRQRFTHRDLFKNKAFCLAKNLREEGFLGSTVTGHSLYIQEYEWKLAELSANLVICGVDNDQTRVWCSRYCFDHSLPAIFTAVSRDADQGYVFVQEPGGACFGCLFPDAVGNEITPCPGVPAVLDILKIVGGLVLYASDTLLMQRRRDWNYRLVRLAGYVADEKRWIPSQFDCDICRGKGRDHGWIGPAG